MCGICGVVTDRLTSDERRVAVERMSAALVHRGPDGAGLVSFDGVCLGMRRLAILDLSQNGRQPMSNEDGSVWLVFNGEIYNFQELRERLEHAGHRFRSRTDGETILHLYEEHATAALNHLRGMFGFAIWDMSRRRLLLARDRLGIKPLYYAEIAGGIVFASEVQALLAGGLVARELDLEALDSYLSFGYVPPPRTLIRGVRALLSGHLGELQEGKLELRRWWTVPRPGTTDCRVEEAPAQLRALLDESIRLHRVSDVPIGAFLSGGIDSSAVVGLMARTLPEPVRTFSIGFADGPSHFNELEAAGAVARAFGTAHTEVILTGKEVAADLPRAIRYLDQPSFDGMNTYIVSKAAREGGVTVALSGLGGDEVFGGYDTYAVIPRWARAVRAWGALPLPLRRTVSGLFEYCEKWRPGDDRARKFRNLHLVDSPLALYALARLTLWPKEKAAFYADPPLDLDGDTIAALERLVPGEARSWEMVSLLELSTYMGWRLLRDTDVMSMAHSLEVRVPLIDHRIVEFVCGLPSGWEQLLGHPKRLLVASLSDVLPDWIVNRRKQGFAFPFEHWMRRHLRPVVEDALSERTVRSRGLFKPEAIARLRERFFAGDHPYPTVWQFVVLELWMRQAIDGDAIA